MFRLDSDGYVRSWCNPCGKAYNQPWRAKNRAMLLARRRAAYAHAKAAR
jgi:hypothetical protein